MFQHFETFFLHTSYFYTLQGIFLMLHSTYSNMPLSHLIQTTLTDNHDFPIKTEEPVHIGKVRSVYWLSKKESKRLIETHHYDVPHDTLLAIMIMSDRISAFDCIWKAKGGLNGVPGKGAALNAIARYWFDRFKAQGIGNHHIVDIPHPMVWIVQKAQPLKIEGIARHYLTGSMWRAYQKGERIFCGLPLNDGLTSNQKFPELLLTPSTKGIIKGLKGIPEKEDTNITRSDLEKYYRDFQFQSLNDIEQYEWQVKRGFSLISKHCASKGQLFVDTKFELGYVTNMQGQKELIYIDEVGTPDSSRMWDALAFSKGTIQENSKEDFRKNVLHHFSSSRDILLNSERFSERLRLAKEQTLPLHFFMELSDIYQMMAQKITGSSLPIIEHIRESIIDTLHEKYQLIV
jgi:phosphoribosylaminoimidazole-succinocarboxamide synthase